MLSRSQILARTFFYFFFTDTATTEIYTLSLHDALPISRTLLTESLSVSIAVLCNEPDGQIRERSGHVEELKDRKSTRLNSSHVAISYAVFCLKKKICTMMHMPMITSELKPMRSIINTMS